MLLAALFLPLIATVALAIKVNNCDPVLNRRVRICRNNRWIQTFEFRTKANCSREVTRGYQFLHWTRINTQLSCIDAAAMRGQPLATVPPSSSSLSRRRAAQSAAPPATGSGARPGARDSEHRDLAGNVAKHGRAAAIAGSFLIHDTQGAARWLRQRHDRPP
jgi:hypothetical protein